MKRGFLICLALACCLMASACAYSGNTRVDNSVYTEENTSTTINQTRQTTTVIKP